MSKEKFIILERMLDRIKEICRRHESSLQMNCDTLTINSITEFSDNIPFDSGDKKYWVLSSFLQVVLECLEIKEKQIEELKEHLRWSQIPYGSHRYVRKGKTNYYLLEEDLKNIDQLRYLLPAKDFFILKENISFRIEMLFLYFCFSGDYKDLKNIMNIYNKLKKGD